MSSDNDYPLFLNGNAPPSKEEILRRALLVHERRHRRYLYADAGAVDQDDIDTSELALLAAQRELRECLGVLRTTFGSE
jgi:hypothetical protein